MTRVKIQAVAHDQVDPMLDLVDILNIIDRRQKPLVAYTCSRIGALVSLRVQDYFQNGKRTVLRLRTKGGKEKEFPVHHLLEDILDSYLDISGLRTHPLWSPLSDHSRQ
jgi:integrase